MKVIILSYFYPPCNFVGGERTFAWSKYLADSDVYPIIITRQWNDNQLDITSKVENNRLEIEKTSRFEIHRLPFQQSFRDKLTQYPRLLLFQKAFTFFELFFSNFFIRALPYANFFNYAESIIKEYGDVRVVIASGKPFQSFFIGHMLKKRFPNIHWIPDYRDEWNSHQQKKTEGLLGRFLQRLEIKSERKWTQNASFFLSVSEYWVESIGAFINKKGITIKNGFERIPTPYTQKSNPKTLTISYIGTLYEYQEIETFIDCALSLIQNNNYEIHTYFIGINLIPEQEKRVINYIKGFERYFTILPRINKNELVQYYEQTDLLLVTAFKGIKGWYPVKLFEYYQTPTPLFLCPSDKGEMEEFISKTNCGYIAYNKEDGTRLLNDLYQKKMCGSSISKIKNHELGMQYSREYQTELLADELKNL